MPPRPAATPPAESSDKGEALLRIPKTPHDRWHRATSGTAGIARRTSCRLQARRNRDTHNEQRERPPRVVAKPPRPERRIGWRTSALKALRRYSRRRPLVAVQHIAVDLVLVELATAAEEPARAVGAALYVASEVVQPAPIDAAITAASSRPLEEEGNARAVQHLHRARRAAQHFLVAVSADSQHALPSISKWIEPGEAVAEPGSASVRRGCDSVGRVEDRAPPLATYQRVLPSMQEDGARTGRGDRR